MTLISYSLVDVRTGEIEVSGTCQAEDFDHLQEQPHQIKVVGAASRATHYYTPLGLVAYTPEQRAAKAQPVPHSNWSNHDMRWHDVRAFPELQGQRWDEIKAAREAAVHAVLATPYGPFDADPRSRAAIAETLAFRTQTGTPAEPVLWTTADNQVVSLTLAQLGEVAQLVATRTQACHDLARQLRQQIDAAITPAELAAITWPQAP